MFLKASEAKEKKNQAQTLENIKPKKLHHTDR
jgi:hypothetical protein